MFLTCSSTLEKIEYGKWWYGIIALLGNVEWFLKYLWHYLKALQNFTKLWHYRLRCFEDIFICIIFEDSKQKVALLMLHNVLHRALILSLLIRKSREASVLKAFVSISYQSEDTKPETNWLFWLITGNCLWVELKIGNPLFILFGNTCVSFRPNKVRGQGLLNIISTINH